MEDLFLWFDVMGVYCIQSIVIFLIGCLGGLIIVVIKGIKTVEEAIKSCFSSGVLLVVGYFGVLINDDYSQFKKVFTMYLCLAFGSCIFSGFWKLAAFFDKNSTTIYCKINKISKEELEDKDE